MEGLAPIHSFVINFRYKIESGHSVRESLKICLKPEIADEFTKDLQIWILKFDQNRKEDIVPRSFRTSLRQNLLLIIEMGLGGMPIIKYLNEFELRIREECQQQLEHELRMLPYRVLPALLLFVFPATLILLFGPILANLMRGLT